MSLFTSITRRRWLRAAACIAFLGVLTACGGGGDGDSANNGDSGANSDGGAPPPASAFASVSIHGKVTTGTPPAPVVGATVSAQDQKVSTDADGNYVLNVKTPASTAVVLVKQAGFGSMAKQVMLLNGQATEQNITMYPVDARTSFDAASGKSIVVNGALLDISPDSIQTADGQPYSGTVTASASFRDPTTAEGQDAQVQPAIGMDGDVKSSLVGLGSMEVNLSDPAGQPLELRPGKPASITVPGISALDAGAATVPLWHYDEDAGVWRRDGEAQRQTDGSYMAQVQHFSAWEMAINFNWQSKLLTCANFANGQTGFRAGLALELRPVIGGDSVLITYSDGTAPGSWQWPSGTISVDVPSNFSYYQMDYIESVPDGWKRLPDAPIQIPGLAPGESATAPCVTLTGIDPTVPFPAPPPPPPPPPQPVAADAAPAAFVGQYRAQVTYEDLSGATAQDVLEGLSITVDSEGRITGSGVKGVSADPASPDSPFKNGYDATVTGKLAVGGRFSITITGMSPGPFRVSGTSLANPVETGGGFILQGNQFDLVNPGDDGKAAVLSNPNRPFFFTASPARP